MLNFKNKHKKLDNYSLHHGVGLVASDDPNGIISEQFKTIRTNIQFSSVDKPLKSILFTSSEPSEGKSTVSSNIAVTWAQQNEKVLLIDADLRRPTVHQTFNVDNKKGLSNYLLGNATFEEIIQPTDFHNLYVITSGPIPPNPSELLGSNKIKQLFTRLSESFGLLILDAPPINTVTDAQVLANLVDGVILVVPQGIANKAAVAHAKQALLMVHAHILGAVMNRVIRDQHYGYYGSYYGLEKYQRKS
ncbi:CpsD/CapB family tyrosine-protein kinase [Companilactobacillus bobalius]|uniref:non-specific protein-tyrosine kinase n=2 Tax=Companilactobacillus bobalius TaxID=2801451 RepID=A0A202FCL0_9LACO|nr:CpsD/CapB family tyrosine-protein kinase [Companilactobacillus bobalius]GEO58564.1 tyrosine protein kinase [Companilactobacillus paralimentarius]KAE9557500.1 exopolysaccharide biosynthesis protein [Companilactobacillus bobalius]KAE9561571.1 exopolysaccharide biosynthesis protein [Companilactobacillus bobalius]KAE9563647.1 exopolysaccharide biosynthesis protein [Companilactobacillus bobalius]KRK82469.1 tyrosine-protein kinase [Companilactobacillus bobalius DSM 19674]